MEPGPPNLPMTQEPLFSTVDEMEWSAPTTFPSLASAKRIALDVETRDPDLKALGPGSRRRDPHSYLIGVSVATDDGFCGYYPVRHDVGPNFDPVTVFAWLGRELSRPGQTKVGVNLLYDLDWLAASGVRVVGPFRDVLYAEALLDDHALGSYGLEALARKYLGGYGAEDLVARACRDRGLTGAPQGHLWRLPPRYVGAYAEADVRIPLAVLDRQEPLLAHEGLTRVFALECVLLPLLLRLRETGVRVEREVLAASIEHGWEIVKGVKAELCRMAGRDVNPWSAASLAFAFDALGLIYPRTAREAPSFTKEWLEGHAHPFPQKIREVRTLEKLVRDFLQGGIRDSLVGDRIHCLFHPLKSDANGTVTGRFSASNPNLQQIPRRDKTLGSVCRRVFVPEDGHDWGKLDYSQVEIRIFAHCAYGDGADAMRDRFRKDRGFDYHTWCAEEAGCSRDKAKSVNFGLLYGMGLYKLAAHLGVEIGEAKDFLNRYRRALPFAKGTLDRAMARAEHDGYIRTVLGRRRRFPIRPADENGKEWRPNTHKALNSYIQGSAADLYKTGMSNAWAAGIFDVLVPHLMVHDETDVSIPRTAEGAEAWIEFGHIMENAIKFRVPIYVDQSRGPNWGETA